MASENINSNPIVWYPGHMVAAKRSLQKELPLIDFVIELLDARVPISSQNPDIKMLFSSKPRLTLLTKSSLANDAKTSFFKRELENDGRIVIPIDCKTNKNINLIPSAIKELVSDKLKKYADKGMDGRRVRGMVAGITNVGKSTFINTFTKTTKAKAEDRPGVTRINQWISSPYGIDLLDTPGLLWHKFDDPIVGVNLAITGAIRDEILDLYSLSLSFLGIMKSKFPDLLEARYKIKIDNDDESSLFEKIARKRGFLVSGGEIDADRLCVCLLDEFRSGKIGKITLD